MKYVVLCFSVVIIGLDQLFKKIAIYYLSQISTLPVIEDVFHLSYVENKGAAFGIFDGKAIFLSLFSMLLLIAIILLIVYDRIKGNYLLWSTALILGGGIGNLIDRLLRGYVVDYLDIRLFQFAVFNFADCCVVLGTILVVVYLVLLDNPKSKAFDSIAYEKGEESVGDAIEETSIDENRSNTVEK